MMEKTTMAAIAVAAAGLIGTTVFGVCNHNNKKALGTANESIKSLNIGKDALAAERESLLKENDKFTKECESLNADYKKLCDEKAWSDLQVEIYENHFEDNSENPVYKMLVDAPRFKERLEQVRARAEEAKAARAEAEEQEQAKAKAEAEAKAKNNDAILSAAINRLSNEDVLYFGEIEF